MTEQRKPHSSSNHAVMQRSYNIRRTLMWYELKYGNTILKAGCISHNPQHINLQRLLQSKCIHMDTYMQFDNRRRLATSRERLLRGVFPSALATEAFLSSSTSMASISWLESGFPQNARNGQYKIG